MLESARRANTLSAAMAALVLVLLVGVLLAKPAHAESFTVTSTNHPGTDGCDATECTLSEAIEAANSNGDSDRIEFAPALGGDIELSAQAGGFFIQNDGGLDFEDLVIVGPGAGDLAVDGNGQVQPFEIDSGARAAIGGLTIKNGFSTYYSGGILNNGWLTVKNSTISGNRAYYSVGGIFNNGGTLTVTDSTISGNSSMRDSSSQNGGGGIFNNRGTLMVANSTISGNSSQYRGGGIYGGGGISLYLSDTTLVDTILAGNSTTDSGSDASGVFTSKGYNLIGNTDDSSGWIESGIGSDLLNQDPLLGPLQDNGGPTQIHALKADSPAINAIPSGTNGCGTTIATDQRGVERPQGGACDIGAFERDTPLDTATPTLSISDATIIEGDSGTTKEATFTVTRSGNTGGESDVSFLTSDDTATSGQDYVAASGALHFATGEATKTITVPVNGDDADEPDETFFVNLNGPSNATISDGHGVGTIADDDEPVTDTTAPVISKEVTGTLGNNGWYTNNVSVDWSVSDPESKISSQSGCEDFTVTTDQAATTYTCTATSAGGESQESIIIKRDVTKPTNVAGAPVRTPADHNGWYNSPVNIAFSGQDATSGIDSCSTVSYNGPDGTDLTVNGICTDKAGNKSAQVASSAFNYDATDPTNISFSGVTENASFYFEDVPALATLGCTAEDATSGLASCSISSYSNAVGTHTLTATATDKAGNTATKSLSYEVLPWIIKGFYSPVDMEGTLNIAKAGSPVPLKFEVFKGQTELTNTNVVKTFTQRMTCPTTSSADPIESYSSGNTVLHYDAKAGQFVFNWKAPKAPGSCYEVTMSTKDGSKITAYFQLK